MINRHILSDMLIEHEGLRLRPYTDTTGHLTIGVGRNLTDRGISRNEALQMLDNDIDDCIATLEPYTWFLKCNEARKLVLLDMVFNLGLSGLLGFKQMIHALQIGEYKLAASHMLDSKWATQVKRRAYELATIMENGEL